MRADANLIKAVTNDIIPNPAVVSNFYFPGIGKAGCRSDNDTRTDFCPKQSQKPLAKAMQGMGTQGESDRLY
jgi:hypothetical protein